MFLRQAFINIVSAGASIQVIAWLFGVYDELTVWVATHRDLVAIAVVCYVVFCWMTSDAAKRVEEARFKKRIEGASLRRISSRSSRKQRVKSKKGAK